jgi:DNA-binding transcriptional MerR regulator/effector-binding domain-containing protein
MFKIGDFSRLAQVSVRMLRHYDKLGLLTPGYTDKWTGYRYYTIDQLPRLNRIVALNGLGLTLQEIADLLGKDNALPPEQLRGMLLLRRAELERELEERRWQLASVEARLQQIEQENEPDPYEIVVKSVAPLPVASLRLTIPTVAEVGYYCNALYGQLYRQLAAAGVAWREPELTLYHNDEYTETDIDMEVATPVDAALVAEPPAAEHLAFRELPGHDLVAALVFEGQFEEVIGPIQALLRWIGLHRHAPAGPLREVHLSGPAHSMNAGASLPVIELQAPIVKLG